MLNESNKNKNKNGYFTGDAGSTGQLSCLGNWLTERDMRDDPDLFDLWVSKLSRSGIFMFFYVFCLHQPFILVQSFTGGRIHIMITPNSPTQNLTFKRKIQLTIKHNQKFLKTNLTCV